MNTYLEEELAYFKRHYKNQREYLQVVEELIHSLDGIIDNHPEYEKHNIVRRLFEPEKIIRFKVTWMDDNNHMRVNVGYRVQHSLLLGPYKGGIRFHPTVSESILKFLALEQTVKNACTGLALGGGKGGSDFNPKGKSDKEIMAFCQAFMMQLYHHIGDDMDVPAGDIGVGEREIGYLYGYYKSLTKKVSNNITGKHPLIGGSLLRKEATGYGLAYFTKTVLEEKKNTSLEGKKVLISGSGNVAIYTAEKIMEFGAKVVAMSDSDGYIYAENGIDIKAIKEIKEEKRGRIKEYLSYDENATYKDDSKKIWTQNADIALPCATQNELDETAVEHLINQDILLVAEGANMATTKEGVRLLQKNGILFVPSKAANAGGVVVSGFEIAQNSQFEHWSRESIQKRLYEIMDEIFDHISSTSNEYNQDENLAFGANVYGLKRLASAMIKQGNL